MKKVNVEKAVGMILAHDLTRIIPGKFKGPGFRKGHVVRREDIPELLKIGKRHLYVLDYPSSHLHEDEAALRIASAVSGPGLRWTDPVEGKSNIVGSVDGLFKVNVPYLTRINKSANLIVSTLKNNFPVKKGQIVAATRIIPLTIIKTRIERLEKIAQSGKPVLQVLAYRKLKVGAVVTGSEIYQGLVPNEFDRYVGCKVQEYGSEVIETILVPDDSREIATAIGRLKDIGCELIIATGGLSVDPDDVTCQGVRRSGAKIVVYGSPILPGAMFLYARLDDIPILGLPACVYYHPATVFDLVLPRILAGETITKKEIAEMGHGGLCLNCKKCSFPVCPFGK